MSKINLFFLLIISSILIKAQCPTFVVFAPSGTVVGCNPTSIPLNALNTSTLTGITYTWVSASTGAVLGPTINATAPLGSNTFTVLASTPSSTCIFTQTFSISQSTIIPVSNVTPNSRTLTCNGACQSFTASTTSGTTNIVGNWYSSSTNMFGPKNTPMILCANAPGTYTAEFCSTISGCCSSQTVAVVSNSQIPTVTVTPTTFNGFTIDCSNPNVGLNVNAGSITGPFGYTWTPLPTPPGTPLVSPTGSYTVTLPGQYEIKFIDGYLCVISSTINVFQSISTPTLFGSSTPSVICSGQSVTITVTSNAASSITNYNWIPGGFTTSSVVVNPSVTTVYTINSSYSNTLCTNASITITQNVNNCTGLRSLSNKDSQYIIYPNPSNGQFYLKGLRSDSIVIEVFDLNDKLIYSGILKGDKHLIDLSDKPNGIYLFKIKDSSSKIQHGKLIIQ